VGEFLRLALRVNVDTVGDDTFAIHGMFYSRRAGGLYYRWHYEAHGDRWWGSRVHLEATPKSFRQARGRVPPTLRTRLLEHCKD
jgi:hypothetical protein